MSLSGYRVMWVLVMFDLPVTTKAKRKQATEFRKFLLQDGFNMVQFSVYTSPCPSEENAQVHVERIKKHLPPDGQVRILKFTDKQYARMECFLSRKGKKPERSPRQITLF